MDNSLNTQYIEPLQKDAMINTFGGAPSKETGFWYDVFYFTTMSFLITPRPTAWATGRISIG